jgi:hypothetical protein
MIGFREQEAGSWELADVGPAPVAGGFGRPPGVYRQDLLGFVKFGFVE